MRFWKIRGPSDEREKARIIIRRLEKNLASQSDRTIETLAQLATSPMHVEELASTLPLIAKVRSTLPFALAETKPERAVRLLRDLDSDVMTALHSRAGANWYGRQTLARMLDCIVAAITELEKLQSPLLPPPGTERKTVVIHTDLLFQAFHCLLPPERMVVVSGQRGAITHLSAIFDVTGDANPAHVQAHPQRMAQALIAMAKADSFLAAWGHSHPGTGPGATRPSCTDTDQHAAWIRNYSKNLLSFILVRDGYCHFWGTAIEKGLIQVELVGGGITKEKNHANVYHLDV